ncbi:hypothetical protein PG991_009070 [Apiospora marii]|uniref:HAT C-terminal dimerisation domain-containing protein n=1 Tax=Apiospora marii TaxID=335849 RepID=A0ABR1RKN1_9PEZI
MRRSTLINTLKMPIYHAAADSIPTTNQGHEAALFRHFPGFAFSERVRDTSSWLWQFGYDIQNRDSRRWVCKLCIIANSPLPKNIHPSGLQNAAGHLYTKHFVLAPPDKPKSREEKKRNRSPRPLQSIARYMSLTPGVPVEQAVINKLVKMFDRKRFQQLLMEWIVAQNQPFSIVEQPELRAIFEYLNPQVSIQEAHLTRPSIKSLIVTQYSKHRSRVIDALKDAPGRIHLVFDGWRSGNRKIVIGLTCVFPHQDYQPRKVTLGISEMPGRHQGEDVARVVSDLVTQFDIGEKIGACVTDNASSNDTEMHHLGETFDWGGWTGRCFGHILNLAAKLLLHGNAEQPVETFIETHEQLTDAEYDLWRKEGPVALQHLEDILTSFETVLTRLEGDGQIRRRAGGFRGSYGNIWDVLPAYEYLLSKLEHFKEIANGIPDPIQFRVGVNAAWDKLTAYYNRLDDVYFYYAAFTFHPAQGWGGLARLWRDNPPDWLARAKMIVKSHWINEYKHMAIPPKQPAHAAILPQAARREGRYAANDWDEFIQSTQRIENPLPAEIGDEWDAWMAELPDPDDRYVTDPIVYWFIRRFKYPRLSQMALDTLTIPAMSAECERLFSAAGRLLNSTRSSLEIVIVSMCMALRPWLRAGILHDEEVDQTVISVVERVEQDTLEQLSYGEQVARVTQWIAEGEPRPGSRNRGDEEVDDTPE